MKHNKTTAKCEVRKIRNPIVIKKLIDMGSIKIDFLKMKGAKQEFNKRGMKSTTVFFKWHPIFFFNSSDIPYFSLYHMKKSDWVALENF